MRIKNAAESIVTTLAAAAALVLLNALVFGARAKVDLTEHKIYTLSPASTKLLERLPKGDKVVARAYFGNVPPEQNDKQRYIEQLLTEYAEASGGRLRWEKIEVDDKRAADLKKEGIAPTPIPTVKNDKFELALSFFQVQFQYLDKKESWVPDQNFFRRSMEGLEYDYTSLLRRLIEPKKKVGVTRGYGEPDQTRVIEHPQLGLGDLYEVAPIDWAQKPEDLATVDVLVVNGPTMPVSDKAKWYLDQFLMSGRPVLLLLPGLKWQSGNDQQQQMPNFVQADQPLLGMPAESGLADLLANYGFEIGADAVVDAVNAGPGVLEIGTPPVVMPRYPFHPYAAVVARAHGQVLEGMEVLTVPYASTIKLVGRLANGGKPDGGGLEVLFRTSPQSFVRAGVQAISRGMAIERDKATTGEHVLAYAAWGKFPSYYADKPRPAGVPEPVLAPAAMPGGDGGPAPTPPTPTAGPTLKESPATTRLIVMGNANLASDNLMPTLRVFGGQPFANGFHAFHNMVDWLVQDTDLIAVRGKLVARPLDGLDDTDRLLVKYGNLAGAPLTLVLLGVVYWRVRVARRRRIKL